MTSTMKSLDEFYLLLGDVKDRLESGEIDDKRAATLTNVAGKAFSYAKIKLAYYVARGEIPDLPVIGLPGQPARPLIAGSASEVGPA